jgi:hypothetical protein
MLIQVALEDGFDDDTVVLRVGGDEAYRGEGVTTRTQISRAADTEVDVPDFGAVLEVEVPTRGLREAIELRPPLPPVVALSLRDDAVLVAYPEHGGAA